jgi:protein O-mannosyl-transferase
LFGKDSQGMPYPSGHHLVNLAIHVANTLLLFLVLRWMTSAVWPSAFVAALFAVHPLHVESVAWIAERKDVLSTFFGLLTIGAYAWYAQRPGKARYLLVFTLLGVGLMAKPMLVTLPCLLLLLDYWPLGRLNLGGTAATANRPLAPAPGPDTQSRRQTGCHRRGGTEPETALGRLPGVWRLVLEKVPLLALSAASCAVTYYAQKLGGAVAPIDKVLLGDRIANALLAYASYIGKMFWPAKLAALYPLPKHYDPLAVAGVAILLAAISVAVLWGARRGRRYLAVGWFWYLGTLVPVIGLVQVGSQSMADRYTYLPLVGLFVITAWGAADLAASIRNSRKLLVPLAGTVLLVCILLTTWQVPWWSDNVTLFQHAVDVTEENALAHAALGNALDAQQDRKGAIEHLLRAVEFNPDLVNAHRALAKIAYDENRRRDAIHHLDEVVRIRPRDAQAHFTLGQLLVRQSPRVAVGHYKVAVEIDPGYVKAHKGLADALAARGDTAGAAFHYREVLRLAPGNAEARKKLAELEAWQKGKSP